jgi:hypothetical protein
MRLEQGDKSMQDYYGELQKGLMCCGIVEGTEDSICRFYSGLQRDIQDIVDYKDFNSVNQLFWLAMFAERELQGGELQGKSKVSTTYTQPSTPSSGLMKPSSFRAPPPTSKRAADFGVSTVPKSYPTRPDSGKNSLQGPAQSASSVASSGRTTAVQCHRCKGFGHLHKECPSQQAYIAIEDGYISTSDIEDDEEAKVEEGGVVLGSEDTATFRSIIVQRVLSTQVQQPEKIQYHNLFQIFSSSTTIEHV